MHLRSVKGCVKLFGLESYTGLDSMFGYGPYDEILIGFDPHLHIYKRDWDGTLKLGKLNTTLGLEDLSTNWGRDFRPASDGPHFTFNEIDQEVLKRCVSEKSTIERTSNNWSLGRMTTLTGYPHSDFWSYSIGEVSIGAAKGLFGNKVKLHGTFSGHLNHFIEREQHPTGFEIELEISKL